MSFFRRARPAGPVPPAWMGFLDFDSVLVLTHPDAIQHVLHDNHANYVKGQPYDDVRVLLGDGMLTSDGERWVSKRKLAQPAFHAAALETYHATMVDTIDSFVRGWRSKAVPGRPVDILPEMSRITLRVVTRCLFMVDLGAKEDAMLDTLAELLTVDPTARGGPIVGRIYKYVPPWAKLRGRRALAEFDRAIAWIIASRPDSGDLVSRLMAASTPADAKAIRDEVATFVIAGYETTAIALTWMLYLLSQNPEVERKLRAEIADVVDGRAPAPADIARLTYTTMVIRESMRLYPPIPSFSRQAIRDDVIGGFTIGAKTPVRIKPLLTHRHPEFWPDPERFMPERFSPEQAAARPQCAYLPFGAGPRTCIGNHFAMMEMRIALPMILRAARFTYPRRRPPVALWNLTARPRRGLWMIPEFSTRS